LTQTYQVKKILLFAVFALIAACAISVFSFYPVIEQGRYIVPEHIYVGQKCDCDCILNNRPWYSQFNYWFWLWIIATPIIVFSVTPQSSRGLRAVRTLLAIIVCYSVMNLALHLMWNIRNGPFVVRSNYPWQASWDNPGVQCIGTGIGANLVFTIFFGWIFAVIYTGWCDIAWYQYHKRQTGLLDSNFKRDAVSTISAIVSLIVAKLAFYTVLAFPFAIGILYFLEKFEILKRYTSFFL
jgi:hypothetical protein